MKRTLIIAAVALGFVVTAASAASAAPTNKNTGSATASCDGRSVEFTFVQHENETADLGSAGVILDGGALKIISITGFEPGTTNELFSATTHFGGPANTTCTGTANEFGTTFDFLIEGFIAGGNSA